MDLKRAVIAVILVVMVILGIVLAVFGPKASISEENDKVYQVGTLQGLIEGKYQGKLSVSDLLKHGSMGLGTFEGLDGEMIVIDGDCYQVLNDGTVVRVAGSVLTPFASVTDLSSEQNVTLNSVNNYTVMQQEILSSMTTTDDFVLIVVHAKFTSLTVRSVPGQEEPYPPLADVLLNQTVFQYTNITGTLVGLYSPSYIGTIDSAGFHMHFISDDRRSGGHVLDVSLQSSFAELDYKTGLDLNL